LDFAKVHEKRIIPILAHGKPVNAIPIELINAQWVDFRRKSDFEVQLIKLTQAIAGKPYSDGLDGVQQNMIKSIQEPKSLTFSKKAIITSIIVIGVCVIIALVYVMIVDPSIIAAFNDHTVIPSTPTYQTSTDSPTRTPTSTGTYTPTLRNIHPVDPMVTRTRTPRCTEAHHA